MDKDIEKQGSNKSMDPEVRWNQVISKAFDKVEQQIEDGTVAPSVLTFLLKMGTPKDKLELENLKTKSELNTSRKKQIEETQTSKELAEAAMDAMRGYRPSNE